MANAPGNRIMMVNGRAFGPGPLTVAETWLLMAEIWKSATTYDAWYGVRVEKYPGYHSETMRNFYYCDRGLGNTVDALCELGLVGSLVQEIVRGTIQVALSESGPIRPDWLFPHTPEGAKQRVEFCMTHYHRYFDQWYGLTLRPTPR